MRVKDNADVVHVGITQSAGNRIVALQQKGNMMKTMATGLADLDAKRCFPVSAMLPIRD